MKKQIICILLSVLLLTACLSGCAGKQSPDTVRVATLMGPTGMGMARLMADNDAGKTNNSYTFTVASAPDQITPAVITGEVDIAAVPVNLASVLYQKTEKNVQLLAVNTLGVLYVLENGDAVHSVSDLKGKSLSATGLGSNPEFILNHILRQNGLDPENDLSVEYLTEHAELAAQMVSGDALLGMLPEPNVTSVLLNNGDVRIALDLTEEWNKISDHALVQGCIIVNKEFAEKYPSAVDTFLEEYGASVKYTEDAPADAAALIEQAGIVPKAAIAQKALPNCNICLLTGDKMKDSVSELLQIFYDAEPKSVGGVLPDDGFYR